MAENYKARTHETDKQAKQPGSPMPPLQPVENPPVTGPRSEAKPHNTEQTSPEAPLPRFIRPEWVIVYVTVVYAIITWLTLRSIKRQADLMESQATEARGAAKEASLMAQATLEAIKGQIDVSKEQNALTCERERARISLDITTAPEIAPDICLGHTIKITLNAMNVGSSTAFNVKAAGAILIEELEMWGANIAVKPDRESWNDLDVALIIHPTEGNLPVSISIKHIGSPKGELMPVSHFMFDDLRIKEIVDGQMYIRVDGRFTYNDIFGNTHTTPFLYVWSNRGDKSNEIEDRLLWRKRAKWLNLSGKST